MFSESAEIYDLVYSSFKDYAGEADHIAGILRQLYPRCRTILDAACGTGEHARRLAADHGFRVDGIDIEPAFVRIAAAKLPESRFHVADMSDFALPDRYDAVVCLFSSIGYLTEIERVAAALRCFRRHLSEDGVLLVEPWFAPGVLENGRRVTVTAERDGVRVKRTALTELMGNISRLHFEYEISDSGVTRYVEETHDLGLFTPDELLRAFASAGLAAEYHEEGICGRGLYAATIAREEE